MAENAKARVPHPPAPLEGAHHGPVDGPSPIEAVKAFFERLKISGWFNYRVLGILVFIVVAIIVWQYVASVRQAAAARDWIALDQAANPSRLAELAKEQPTTQAARLAQLILARYTLDEGIKRLKTSQLVDFPAEGILIPQTVRAFMEKENESRTTKVALDPDNDGRLSKKEFSDLPLDVRFRIEPMLARSLAAAEIEKARSSFKELCEVFANNPVQLAESLWGLAKAEEALIGMPKDENPLEHRGLVSTAVSYLDRLAEVASGTPLGTAAKEQALYLNKHSNTITNLQSSLYTPITLDGMPDDEFHRNFRKPPIPPVNIGGIPGSGNPFTPTSNPNVTKEGLKPDDMPTNPPVQPPSQPGEKPSVEPTPVESPPKMSPMTGSNTNPPPIPSPAQAERSEPSDKK